MTVMKIFFRKINEEENIEHMLFICLHATQACTSLVHLGLIINLKINIDAALLTFEQYHIHQHAWLWICNCYNYSGLEYLAGLKPFACAFIFFLLPCLTWSNECSVILSRCAFICSNTRVMCMYILVCTSRFFSITTLVSSSYAFPFLKPLKNYAMQL